MGGKRKKRSRKMSSGGAYSQFGNQLSLNSGVMGGAMYGGLAAPLISLLSSLGVTAAKSLAPHILDFMAEKIPKLQGVRAGIKSVTGLGRRRRGGSFRPSGRGRGRSLSYTPRINTGGAVKKKDFVMDQKQISVLTPY
jgi:hypothetical protein